MSPAFVASAPGQNLIMSPDDKLGEAGQRPTGTAAGSTSAGPTPATPEPAANTRATRGKRGGGTGANMLPEREGRRFGLERLLVRLVATTGIIGIGVALGAILTSQKVQGWIIGLVIAVVTVVLSGILWSSRQL